MFLSDGGDTVRDLQMYLSPESEHWLDWFHITMRLTVMGQFVKRLATELEAADKKSTGHWIRSKADDGPIIPDTRRVALASYRAQR
jgi:hypothetical protein